VFLGGETVVDYSLRLQRELSGPLIWVSGYSNDVMAYIPSLRVWKEGGYEGGGAMVYGSHPARWSSDAEEHIVGTVKELVDGLQKQH
jgi:neutral ceramidase